MIIEPQDVQDDDILALAESVGVVTIPNPKPLTLLQRIDAVANVAHDLIVTIENEVSRRLVLHTLTYVGRHRCKQPERRILGRLMDAGTRLDLRVLATLRSIGRPPQDIQKALNQIKASADRARRDISFFHTHIHGMTDIGERGSSAVYR